MKIKQVTIHNFKSIRNDFILDVSKRITALVGMSESGKTNVLKALEKFNRKSNYEEEDFCTFCDEQPPPDSPMISVVFVITIDELERLGEELVIEPLELTVTKCFEGKYLVDGEPTPFEPSSDTPEEIQNFLNEALQLVEDLMHRLHKEYEQRDDLSSQLESVQNAFLELSSYLAQSDQFTPLSRSEGAQPFERLLEEWRSLQDVLTHLPEQTNDMENAIAHLDKQISSVNEALAGFLETPQLTINYLDMLPEILYLQNQDITFLDDSIDIGELETSPENHHTTMNLLNLAGLSIAELKISDTTQRNRKLLRAGQKVSNILKKAWLQEPISLSFDVNENRLHIYIEGREGHFGQPSDRSEGFRWFLSFYVNYVSLNIISENTILLLDEPGINLHASGQKDLLEGFEEISKSTQIIYTTHSAYMINKNYPQRIRAVLKGGHEQGTYIDNKPYRVTKGGVYEPIRSAIGLSLGNSLFLGMKNLIVEGIADHIILAAVSRRFAADGEKTFLNLQEICITPAGGAQNAHHLAYLASHEDMRTVVLLDNDKEASRAVARIHKEGILPKEHVIQIGDIATSKKGDTVRTLEDIFDPDFYCNAVKLAYQDIKGSGFVLPSQPLSEEKIAAQATSKDDAAEDAIRAQVHSTKKKHRACRGQEGIVNQYISLFEGREELGDFDKVLVAKKLAEMIDDGHELPEENSKSFRKLFDRINKNLE